MTQVPVNGSGAAGWVSPAAPLTDRIPVPARITMALDARELYGPDVDKACGTREPHVDRWERGQEVPTARNIMLLAQLTGFAVKFFYEPVPPGPLHSPTWVCWRGRRGCELVQPHWVDERGVLHRAGEKPGTPPAGAQTTLL